MFKDSKDNFSKIYIACGYTDLRNGVDGLARIIVSQYELDPLEEDVLFLFCGRSTNKIKGLVWEGDGFVLIYKRLENGRFQWPRHKDELKDMTAEQFDRLMHGFTIEPTIHKSYAKYVL